MSEETYTVAYHEVKCSNCKRSADAEKFPIPKGTQSHVHIQKLICDACGCLGTLKLVYNDE